GVGGGWGGGGGRGGVEGGGDGATGEVHRVGERAGTHRAALVENVQCSHVGPVDAETGCDVLVEGLGDVLRGADGEREAPDQLLTRISLDARIFHLLKGLMFERV